MARVSVESVCAMESGRDPPVTATPPMTLARIPRLERFALDMDSVSVASACARPRRRDVTLDSTARSVPLALDVVMSSRTVSSARCTRPDRWARTRRCAPRTARCLCPLRRRRLKVREIYEKLIF